MNLKSLPSVQLSLTFLSSWTFEFSYQHHTVLVLTWFDLSRKVLQPIKLYLHLLPFTTIICVLNKYCPVLYYQLSWRHCQTVPVTSFDVNIESLLIFSNSCDIFLSSCIFCGLSFSCQSHTDLHYGLIHTKLLYFYVLYTIKNYPYITLHYTLFITMER